mmetsp:Transcript_24575/g.48229  ORF Transcript_24575/g.48229 Transcript_24575/m.48229 type:complete len:236 (-) Transcript_24575:346-1053(-)
MNAYLKQLYVQSVVHKIELDMEKRVVDFFRKTRLELCQLGEIENHEGILQCVLARLVEVVHVEEGGGRQNPREEPPDFPVALQLTRQNVLHVVLCPLQQLHQFPHRHLKALVENRHAFCRLSRRLLVVASVQKGSIGSHVFLFPQGIDLQGNLVEGRLVLGIQRVHLPEIGLDAEVGVCEPCIHKQVDGVGQGLLWDEEGGRGGIELLNGVGRRVQIRPCAEPPHNLLPLAHSLL